MSGRMERLILLMTAMVCSSGALPIQAAVAPPTQPRDLVVFIAREKADLYRLVGSQPVPYGAAKFVNPKTMVADPGRKCLYVLDYPRLLTEKIKLWRIAGDGSAQVILQTDTARGGGPFGLVVSLGLDRQGRPLVADRDSGLWRLNPDGQLQHLLKSEDKPLVRMTAVTGLGHGWLVATSYLYEVSQGGAEMIQIDKNQGGLFQINPQTNAPAAACLVENHIPGGAEHETHWRAPSSLFVDAAGRIILVDAGTSQTTKEEVYIGGRPTTRYRPQRVMTSTINGGVFVRHPDGRFENLTFKNPEESSGPMRRPAGAAQWSDDTYIVADPGMYVEGINGTGGLLLLKLDGSREPRWPFGYQIQPVGVAVLRGAGTPVQPTATKSVQIADLAGTHTAGKITAIESVSWECKPAHSNDPLIGIGMGWEVQPTDQAAAKLRSVFEGARWSVSDDGTLAFCGNGVDLQAQENPAIMSGKVTAVGQLLSAQAQYRKTRMFDTQLGSLDARLRGGEPGTVLMDVTINIFTNTERLKGTFTQVMPIP